MLPPAHRLRDGDGFATAVRRGRRAAGHELVVHLDPGDVAPLRVGFVVSRAVGNAVQRNRVKRRLRHLVAERLATPGALPAGGTLVVRARPAAVQADWTELGRALDRSLDRVRAEVEQ